MSKRPSDRAIDGDRKSSSRSSFDTLTSALCSTFKTSLSATPTACLPSKNSPGNKESNALEPRYSFFEIVNTLKSNSDAVDRLYAAD